MNPREREVLARHYLLRPQLIPPLWRGMRWEQLAVVAAYGRAGAPVEMARSDPFMYRKLCAAACEYRIRGFDCLDPARILELLARNPLPGEAETERMSNDDDANKAAGPGLTRQGWEERLTVVGDHLAQAGASADLVALGSVPNILAGQPERTTLDLDIWRPDSRFRESELRAAVEAAGLLYDPKDVMEPDRPYVQIVGPGIVQLGRFEPVPTHRLGGLTLSQPPVVNLVASKLCRANERDLYDIAWLCARQWPDVEEVRRVIRTFPRAPRQTAEENLVYLEALAPPTPEVGAGGYPPLPGAAEQPASPPTAERDVRRGRGGPRR